MEKQTMGAFISALRKAKGITQKELAEMLNVSDKAVSRWECDQTAPDIMLIPLIADIFGVTADELIRGGRIKNEQTTDTQKSSKRLETILESKFASYKTKSVIPIAIVLVGIIIGIVSILLCDYREIAIGISLVLFVAAVTCQIIFLLNFKNSISTSDLNDEIISSFKLRFFKFSFWIFTALLCLEALIISVDWRLFLWSGPALSIITFLICVFVKSIIIKKSALPFTEKEKEKAKLSVKAAIIYAVALAVLAEAMIDINLNCHNWIEKPAVFCVTESKNELEDYLKKEFVDYFDNENYYKVEIADDNQLVFSDDIENECFIHEYSIKRDKQNVIHIKLWTEETNIKAHEILDDINVGFVIAFVASLAVAVEIFIKKYRKI
ncbi:MAG: helix-turn-helix domain-containing protein [Clostridia bacterium]|nr:helix-turn-helix domain-containing protein [Clostridia bacterium]